MILYFIDIGNLYRCYGNAAFCCIIVLPRWDLLQEQGFLENYFLVINLAQGFVNNTFKNAKLTPVYCVRSVVQTRYTRFRTSIIKV